MKILIFNTLYYPNQLGGAEKSVQLLAEGLLVLGQESVVVCTSNKDYVDTINGVKVYYVNTNNIYWAYNAKEEKSYKKPLWHLIDSYNMFAKNKIENIIKNENPDVVHTNNLAGFSDIVWKIAKKQNIKIVHTLRDYYQLCPRSTMFKNNKNCENQCFSCKIYSIPKKEASNYVDVVVGISKFILDRHIKYDYFKNAQQEIIYNPIKFVNNIKKEKKEKDNIISLGYVGSLFPSKGIEFLLEKYSKLDLTNTRLLVFGKGINKKYENNLKAKYNQNNIIFKGFMKPKEIYPQIDILIVPSLWNEPFGRIVPEANSYGIPVLVSNRGGLPELVKEGKNGYVFDPDIEEDFEKQLELILKMYKTNSFKFDVSSFEIKNLINRYLELYRK
jgi:glycosyltransferase involved in cell wall biosynthesis